jgi:hypothetical protein
VPLNDQQRLLLQLLLMMLRMLLLPSVLSRELTSANVRRLLDHNQLSGTLPADWSTLLMHLHAM